MFHLLRTQWIKHRFIPISLWQTLVPAMLKAVTAAFCLTPTRLQPQLSDSLVLPPKFWRRQAVTVVARCCGELSAVFALSVSWDLIKQGNVHQILFSADPHHARGQNISSASSRRRNISAFHQMAIWWARTRIESPFCDFPLIWELWSIMWVSDLLSGQNKPHFHKTKGTEWRIEYKNILVIHLKSTWYKPKMLS